MNELNASPSLFSLLTPINHWDYRSVIVASGKIFQNIQPMPHPWLCTLDNSMKLSHLGTLLVLFWGWLHCLRECLAMSGNTSGCRNCRGGIRSSLGVKARDASAHPTMHKPALQQEVIQPKMSIVLRSKNSSLNRLVILHLFV